MIIVLVALIGTVSLADGECHKFLGFSTCGESAEVDNKYSFSVEWWVVNVNLRKSEIRRCLRLAQQSPVWMIIDNIPFINKMLDAAFKGTVFERVFEQATAYYKDKDFPVDLLATPELTYT